MFYINGTGIGGLKSKKQSGGTNIVRPEVPGKVLIAPYYISQTHTKLEYELIIDGSASTFEQITAYIHGLIYNNPDGVYYVNDDLNTIYDNSSSCWMVIETYSAEKAIDNQAGKITLGGYQTDDHSDSTYTPP